MKNIRPLALVIGMLNVALLVAQPTLTFEKHALKEGIDNPMSYCSYSDEGLAGENVSWDFSSLEFKKSFTGYLKHARNNENHIEFKQANTSLQEFNSLFFFDVSEYSMEQYGYSSADGRIITKYDVPFVKMKYPFTFGDAFTGAFSGKTYASGKEAGDVQGSYDVAADAYGTLILPGEAVYENTLRIRTEKRYTHLRNNFSQDIEIVTYRWYNSAHRYPLLTLTSFSTKSANSNRTSYQAAYNNNAVTSLPIIVENDISLYPNPARTSLTLAYSVVSAGTLDMRIMDSSGKILKQFKQIIDESGQQYVDLSSYIQNANPGNYWLIIESDNLKTSKTFTIAD